jgi:hypothetical protein
MRLAGVISRIGGGCQYRSQAWRKSSAMQLAWQQRQQPAGIIENESRGAA